MDLTPKKTVGYTRTGWMIWGLASLFYFYQFILRGSPNVMADALMTDFAINASSFGLLTAFYYYVYAFLQIPVGVFLDRFGPQKVLRLAIILCISGTLVFSFAHNLWIAALGRALIGAGASAAFLGAVCVSHLWFPPERLALIVGSTIALGKMGGMAANLPLALLLDVMHWRNTLWVLAALGLVLGIAMWAFIQNAPPSRPFNHSRPSNWSGVWASLKILLRRRGIWFIALYGSLMYLPLTVFADVWGTSFLIHAVGLDRAMASIGVMMVFMGSAIGAPLMALFSDALKTRRAPMLFSAVLSVVVSGCAIFIPGVPHTALFVLLFFVGLCMTGQTLVFVSACEKMPPHMSGMVAGVLNMIIMMGGVIFQPVTGFLIDFFWDGTLSAGVPVYQAIDYRLAMAILPLSALLSFVLTFFLPETHPEKVEAKDTIFAET